VFYILGIIMVLLGIDMDTIRSLATNKMLTYSIVIFNIITIYTITEGATKGRTLGKLITKTRAVNYDLAPITWKDAFIRSLVRLAPFDPISGLSGMPWHDKWSKTYVVRNSPVL